MFSKEELYWINEHNLIIPIFFFFSQIGLAGNLKDYVLRTHTGEAKKGSDIYTFDGSPVGYTSSPVETVCFFLKKQNGRYLLQVFILTSAA